MKRISFYKDDLLPILSKSEKTPSPGEIYRIRGQHQRKYTQCLLIFLTLVMILFLLYIPPYTQIQSRLELRNVGVPGWDFNTSREASIYVLPDNTTSIHESNLCSSPKSSDNPFINSDQNPMLLIIIVCSAVANFEQRDAIRKSWASEYNVSHSNASVKVGFLLGQPENETIQSYVDDESYRYNDIIQERFIDSYNNLSLKSIMMLKWVNTYCSTKTKFIMKTDDDMYVNVPNLIKLLKARINPVDILMGCLICQARPIADTKNKWYSPKYMYSGHVYPNYLSGTGYVMSIDVSRKLYRAALKTPLFHLEDVYITGLTAEKAHIKPRHNPAFTFLQRKFDPCIFKDAVTSHQVTPDNLLKMYTMLKGNDLQIKCHLQEQNELTTAAPTKGSALDIFRLKFRRMSRHKIVIGKKAKNSCV